MKALVRLIGLAFLSGLAVLPAQAAFSSLYVFGDGVSSTTGGPGGATYYQKNYSNGRVWIEVLAQRQGVTFDASKNPSDEWNDSTTNLTFVSQFSAADANTSLFVVWCNDADFVDDIQYGPYPSLDTIAWNNAINNSLNVHSSIISTLYAKGARTLIMPNAVDITKIPQFAYEQPLPSSDAAFIRQMVTNFNTGFAAMLNRARAAYPDLTIYAPDIFTLLNNMLANPGSYGLVNPGYAALENQSLSPWSLTGPGASYVFWDVYDPTAKAHEVLADITQQLISQATISKLTSLNGSNRLDIANIPIGLSGFVDGRTNLVLGTWTQMTNFASISATQSIFVPTSRPQRFYRLRFPFVWSPP